MGHRRRCAALALAGTFAFAACGGDDDATSAAIPADEAQSTDGAGGDDADDKFIASDNSAAPETAGQAINDVATDFNRDIIRNVGITMATSNVDSTVRDIRRIVNEGGGAVFSSDVSIGDEQDDGSVSGGGQMTVRIPPPDLDDLLTDLDGAGFVTRISQDAQDVTSQLVDLDIRIRQAEASVDRVELLLIEATELGDVFAIETELNDRIVKLEQLRAQQRNTDDLVALATVTINVEFRSPDAIEELQADDGIGDAFSDGWGAFVGAVFALGYVLALTAPFLIVIGLVLMGAWLLGRRLTRRSAARREQQRLDADRRGTPVAPYPAAPSTPSATPSPPIASQRTDGPEAETGSTLVADAEDHDD